MDEKGITSHVTSFKQQVMIFILALKSVIENGTDRMHCVSMNYFSKSLSSLDNDHLICHLVLVNKVG